jgi:hypothetical protein
MNPEGKLAQGSPGKFFMNDDHFRPDDQRCDARFIDRAVVMPRTGSALLIVKGGIVMMDRGKNGAHAHVEQAQNCCNGSLHSDDVRNLKPKNSLRQAHFRPWETCEFCEGLFGLYIA